MEHNSNEAKQTIHFSNIDNINLPKGYKPSEEEDYMSPFQLKYFLDILLDQKHFLTNEREQLIEHLKNHNLSQSDEHDRAISEMSANLDIKTYERYADMISHIDKALDRIYKGEYGYSEESEEKIGIYRLIANPTATLSVEEQEGIEESKRILSYKAMNKYSDNEEEK